MRRARGREIEMVKLTFYGGVNEIGGNKILLEDRGTKDQIKKDLGTALSVCPFRYDFVEVGSADMSQRIYSSRELCFVDY